jgi:mevalonate kinase
MMGSAFLTTKESPISQKWKEAMIGLNLDDEGINEAAFEGEKAYHGTPSGIDNTASTYGGLIWFVKNLGSCEVGPKGWAAFRNLRIATLEMNVGPDLIGNQKPAGILLRSQAADCQGG